MNKNFKTKLIGILILALIAAVCVLIYYINSSAANTVTVYKETVENKIFGEGIVCSESTLIYANESGEALFNCQEGKLITPYVKIATVYTGALDDKTKENLRGLNDKIVYMEANEKNKANIIGDISSLSRDINGFFSDVITETNSNNYENVYKVKNEITAYNKKLMELKGEKAEATGDKVQEEIITVESGLNVTKSEYKSTANGMFSTKVTNFDELLNPEKASELTVSQFDELYKTEVKELKSVEKGKPFCKIINHYEWYVVAAFKTKEIEDISEGKRVEIRVVNNSDLKVDATVVSISPAENNRAVVVLKSTKNLNNIWTSNKVEFELVKSTYTGFKIPPAAVLEKDGAKGVFVIKGGIYKFVEIEPLLSTEKYILVKDRTIDGEPESSNVILYDYVVLNPEKVTEGDFAN